MTAQPRLPGITDVPDVDELDADSWATPEYLVRAAYHVLGDPIGLDPCSNARSIVRARVKWTKADDCLSHSVDEWASHRTIWLNPPYSDPGPFLQRLAAAVLEHPSTRGIALLKHDHSTAWWKAYCKGRPLVLLERRVTFLGASSAANFASTLVLFKGRTTERYDPEPAWHGLSTIGEVRR